jgi:hypothetical protein
MSGEKFTIKLLTEVLWRSEGKLFFNERYERIVYLQKMGRNYSE